MDRRSFITKSLAGICGLSFLGGKNEIAEPENKLPIFESLAKNTPEISVSGDVASNGSEFISWSSNQSDTLTFGDSSNIMTSNDNTMTFNDTSNDIILQGPLVLTGNVHEDGRKMNGWVKMWNGHEWVSVPTFCEMS